MIKQLLSIILILILFIGILWGGIYVLNKDYRISSEECKSIGYTDSVYDYDKKGYVCYKYELLNDSTYRKVYSEGVRGVVEK